MSGKGGRRLGEFRGRSEFGGVCRVGEEIILVAWRLFVGK